MSGSFQDPIVINDEDDWIVSIPEGDRGFPIIVKDEEDEIEAAIQQLNAMGEFQIIDNNIVWVQNV